MLASDCHVQPGLISLGGAQPSYVTAAGLLDSKNITRGLGMSICETIVASLGKVSTVAYQNKRHQYMRLFGSKLDHKSNEI